MHTFMFLPPAQKMKPEFGDEIMIPILIQRTSPKPVRKKRKLLAAFCVLPYSVQRFLQRVSAKAGSASITTLMESTLDECSEESGWTTILCGSPSQDNDGGDGFSSHIDDYEDDDTGDFGVDDDDDGSSSLASDACSHAYRDLESCFSHSGNSNAYGGIGVQKTDDGAASGGSWYGYNDEGGGYGGGGRNYSLCCERKIGHEKGSGTSVRPEQEKKIFAAKSELPMQANAVKGTLEDDPNHGLIVNCQFSGAISRTSIFEAFKNQADQSEKPYTFREW